jgi:hypothetical protein
MGHAEMSNSEAKVCPSLWEMVIWLGKLQFKPMEEIFIFPNPWGWGIYLLLAWSCNEASVIEFGDWFNADIFSKML